MPCQILSCTFASIIEVLHIKQACPLRSFRRSNFKLDISYFNYLIVSCICCSHIINQRNTNQRCTTNWTNCFSTLFFICETFNINIRLWSDTTCYKICIRVYCSTFFKFTLILSFYNTVCWLRCLVVLTNVERNFIKLIIQVHLRKFFSWVPILNFTTSSRFCLRVIYIVSWQYLIQVNSLLIIISNFYSCYTFSSILYILIQMNTRCNFCMTISDCAISTVIFQFSSFLICNGFNSYTWSINSAICWSNRIFVCIFKISL